MMSVHSRVKSSNIQAIKTGRGLQPLVSLQIEQVVNSAGWRDGQVMPSAQQAQTHRAGFRGFNPQMSGGNSRQKNVSRSVTARPPKPNAWRPLDDPLRGAPLTKPATPVANLPSTRRGPRAEEGLSTPRHRLLWLLAGPQPRSRLAERERHRPGRCRARACVPSSALLQPRPTQRAHPHDWVGRAIDGPEPRSAPETLSPA